MYAQEIAFESFKGNSRLPSNELHGIVEDKLGNKWVASDAGLICITGNNVKVFTKKDGLASDVVLKIYYDVYNRIWIAGPSGVLSVVSNGRILPVPANEKLKQIDPTANGINRFTTGTDSCLYGIFSNGKSKMFRLSANMENAVEIKQNNDILYNGILYTSFEVTES